MTLETAKQRRLTALNQRATDRDLVKPAAHPSHVKLPDEGTLADYLMHVLLHGCTVEDLERETGWSKSTVMVNLYKVAKKSGFGIRRRGDTLSLTTPLGMKKIYPRAKVVASESTLRSMAADVVIPAEDAPGDRARPILASTPVRA